MTARVAHHFDDARQQFHAATLGMWVFLCTEVMLFGGIFAGYAAYRFSYPEAFTYGSHLLHLKAGTVNTAVLLTSSLLVALAVQAAHSDRRRATAWYLIGGIVLGLAFLGIKGYEYHEKYIHHQIPGAHFHIENVESVELERQIQLFTAFYFALTGLHAAHMVIGIVVLAIVAAGAWRGKFSHEYYTPVEIGGLYWHFVDIVWVFLFPLLYLIR